MDFKVSLFVLNVSYGLAYQPTQPAPVCSLAHSQLGRLVTESGPKVKMEVDW